MADHHLLFRAVPGSHVVLSKVDFIITVVIFHLYIDGNLGEGFGKEYVWRVVWTLKKSGLLIKNSDQQQL